MHCEYCNTLIKEIYGSGRFCSPKCARGFSTKSNRATINQKVSEKLKGREVSEGTKQSLRDAWARGCYDNRGTCRPTAPLGEICVENSKFSTRHVKYRLLEEGIKTWVCEECGVVDWNGKKLTLHLHHVNGNNKDHRIENLQILCPNCHSQTHNYAGKKSSRAKTSP